ncbi:heparinase II/III family protein [Jeotgalicoccus sp. ATCC 8456]|uniref:heparinase II/III domain-containing protein n=1 Tax=Jeotgalicoccus sp. ATCC 8456 TaxID=946435 RepID=UPI0018E5FDE5|nr:heparinase II/III family protein [Jeotgalicoccus sp. ATCC 8456]QQD85661.1 heparinase II/III family protein [Jeotgalicoccus sp. ATCC 8456]
MENLFKNYLDNNSEIEESVDIKDFDVLSLTKRSRYTDEIVESAMNNIVVPFPNFTSFKLIETKDWDTVDDKYGDSYQLYIHSLRFVNELLTTYDSSKDVKYIDKARDYIENWIEFTTNNIGSNMVWYDHPTAQRIQVIIYYLYLAKDVHEINENQYANILKYHSQFLAEDKNYRRNNHGLMMDRSLMIFGNVLNDDAIFNIGYYRSIDTFWHSYSYTGLHLENSPEYHNMVTNMYIELQKYLRNSGKTYGKTIVALLNRASILKNIFTKPNKIIPSIGDSGNGVVKINKNYENFIDYAAGLSIIQEERNEYFLTFISGYASTTHKHIDDLSFNLFYKGKDFFVDPGKFSYSKHPYRSYVKSFKGHSGVFINHTNYKIDDDNRFRKKVKFDYHFENENYFLVKGTNNSYDEGSLSRTILYLKQHQVTILVDEVTAYEDISVLHNFNLHHKVETIKLNNSSYKLVNGNESLILTNHNNIAFDRVIGDKENEPYKAINSVVFNEVVETTQLRNNLKYNTNESPVNIFSIVDGQVDIPIEVHRENRTLYVACDDKKYTINF